jgi:hypothetical protein
MRFIGRYTGLFLLLMPLLLLYSCATFLNKPVQKIFISTDAKVKILSVEKALAIDSSYLGKPATKAYFIPRGKKSLTVTVQVDSTIQHLSLKPKNSFAYWLNIPENYGIGMLADKDNVKRYDYPIRNYLKAKDSMVERTRFCPIEKGSINFSLSLPFINMFDVKTRNTNYRSGGPFGVEGGIEYFYKQNRYLSINTGAATDAFGEYWLFDSGYFDHNTAWFTAFRNNHVVGSFDFGYGIHLSQLKWTRQFGDSSKKTLSVKNVAMGPAFSSQYRVGNYFKIGVLYQPMFIDIRSRSFTKYQHYLSFAAIWKLPLKRKF